MAGVGVNPFGVSGNAGSATGPSQDRSLADFNFQVAAVGSGGSIRVTLDIPEVTEAPEWNRNLRILRKLGGYPTGYADTDADEFLVKSYAAISGVTETHDDADLLPGQIYYYSLFAERNDAAWIHDKYVNRGSAYPYGDHGLSEYLFQSMPMGWQRADVGVGDLEAFLTIIGTQANSLKTDCENLKTLFEINGVHADLLEYLDDKIAWPTWAAAEALQQRKETALAVDIYKKAGRAEAYENVLEGVSDWSAEIVEGWKYVMFSNGLYDSNTPDTTDSDVLPNVGLITDRLKYTNSSEDWHSVSGLAFIMTEIAGVSGPFTEEMISRYHEVIELVKATYVNYYLKLAPNYDEAYSLARVLEEWDPSMDSLHSPEEMSLTIEEDLGYSTSSVALFVSNATASTTNTITDRTFHSALAYV